LSWKLRYKYSVDFKEIESFVADNNVVKRFQSRYGSDRARYLCMFFKWLKVVKGLDVSPSVFLDLLAMKRGSAKPSERAWGKDLALEFSKDNPDFKGKSVSYRYGILFMAIKLFCDYNEVPLTSAKAVFGEKVKRKFHEPPCTISLVKKILSVLNQRDRAICMVSLQSGQSLKQVLIDVNKQCEYIIREINAGKQRIRFNFQERKGNHFQYHSFISVDAIQEIRKWLPLRKQWLEKLVSPGGKTSESDWLFIKKETGQPLMPDDFKTPFRQKLQRHGIWTGPYSAHFHMFRRVFESEASPPERGVSKGYVKFMMGHATDEVNGDRLDVVGGVYDDAPRVYGDVVEKEYTKLEPYLNIYSGKVAESEGLGISEEDLASLKELLQMMKEGKIKIKP